MAVEALRDYAEGMRSAFGFPGLSVAVTDRERLLASEAFGLANLDAGTPVTSDTYFELGSIGKTFTAVVVLQLHEEGLLELHEPVERYLPWFEVRSEHPPIRVHHLLTHTGGLVVGAELSSSSRFDVWALRETEPGFAPGARWHYSNVGYRTLGFVVEELTGLSYAEAVRRRVLGPLALEATDAEVANVGRHRLAVAYERQPDDRPPRLTDPWLPAPWLETGTGDGSPASTMDDLAAFLRALLNRGHGLLADRSFELMTTPWIEADDGWWYGYGLELRERDSRLELRHGGSMPGFGATMLGDLDTGLGVVAAVNATDDRDLTEAVAEAILGLYRDGAAPSIPDPFAVEDAADYEGLYEGPAGRLDIRAERDRLVLAGDEPVTLEPHRRDRFLAGLPELADFFLRFHREDGRVVETVHGGDVYRRDGAGARERSAPPGEWAAYPGRYRAYNPWYPNFRVVLRGGGLVLVFPWGHEERLEPLGDGSFRVGEEWSPERIRFDAVAGGDALRATLGGEAYYRVPEDAAALG